ncbi:MAG: amidase [Nitrospirae bacterium]|nr:amidase [Nitrospirota bacterium]
MDDLLKASALTLADMIRKRKVSSAEVVDAHIRQIEKVNPVLNAVVGNRFEEARKEAKEADRRVRASDGKAAPLLGVPCTIKECFSVEGFPRTGGLYSRRNDIQKSDATTVARLRKAGAIPLGITNVPELCMWMETHNTIYGRTNNAYDPRRIVGGSSGGEGAIISAGGTPFGLGSDIAGSIRMPAFFNGVFGHKPTGGLVPGTGQFPIPSNEALRYVTTGPLARKAEDLMPVLRILAGPDGKDSECRPFKLGDPTKVQIKGLTVLNVENNGILKVSPDLREAQAKCAEHLAQRGAKVRSTRFEGLKKTLEIWGAMLNASGGLTFTEMLGDGKPFRPLPELIKSLVGRSKHTFPAIALAALERIPKWMPKRAEKALQIGRELKEELKRELGPNGVMLYPSYPFPALKHRVPMRYPFHWLYTPILNVMEMPSTQTPLGLNKAGLPLGVQVASLPGHDHLTIAVALELERAFGGWVPPKLAV